MLRYVKTFLGVIFRRPLPGVIVVPILANGQIVLVRRHDNGRWGLPGGLIDWGDTIEMTASRELAEETGLQMTSLGRLVGVYSQYERDPRLHSVGILVEASVEGAFEIRDKGEISAVQAFHPQEIPLENLTHDHERMLMDYWQDSSVIVD
ncbi:MAG: NUDIX hydrolase [Cyanobacteria bacterium P01_H01_bin.15]